METQLISQPLPVIADVPTPKPGLGFQEYAEAIAAAIRGGQPPQFTIGLYGSWGSGKSSLLNAISHALAREGNSVISVYFDAWRYEKTDHIVVPILHAMHNAIRDSGDKKLADHVQRAIRSVIYSLNFSIRYVGGVELKPRDIRENWQSQGLPALDEAFSRPFNELRNITQVLENKRIVILIDDLDRCSPDKVVSVLESINLVMDVPGLIFVLALDYDVLVGAIAQRYPHVSGDAFIQKLVQLPFRVPSLNLERTNFLSSLVPNWSAQASGLPNIVSTKAFSAHLHDIATLGLDANPRQIKRLINSFLLLQRVVISRSLVIDLRLLAALIGVQLTWPEYYERFQNAVVMENSQNPFKVFMEADEKPALIRYANRLLQYEVPQEKLKEILQLTAVVAADPRVEARSELATPTPQRIRNHYKTLRAELSGLGFKKSPADSTCLYSDVMPNLRLFFTPSSVRFEKRGEPDDEGEVTWKTWKIYSLKDDVDLALQALQHPDFWTL